MMKFTESHEWISVEDKIGTVGITDYAQSELGDIVYVELPEVGKNVNIGEEICVLESTKAAADIYSPISGSVIEINVELNNCPELVNQSPEKRGWLYKIELANLNELEELMDLEQYQIAKK